MNRSAKKFTALVAVAGLLAFVAAVVFGWDAILEQWYLRQLDSEDLEVQLEAIDRLEDLDSEKLVPRLVEVIDERQGGSERGHLEYHGITRQPWGRANATPGRGFTTYSLKTIWLTRLAHRLYTLGVGEGGLSEPSPWREQAKTAIADRIEVPDPKKPVQLISGSLPEPDPRALRSVLEAWKGNSAEQTKSAVVELATADEIEKTEKRGPVVHRVSRR